MPQRYDGYDAYDVYKFISNLCYKKLNYSFN